MERPPSQSRHEQICPRCGAPIPAGATEQLCPACLLSGALAGPGDENVTVAPSPSPARAEPTEFPVDFGGYRLRGLLGRGGMGTVYDAEHIATARRVALKMLACGLDSPELRQRFLREGRLAAGISHPNSLYIFGTEEIEGVPVITMEIAGSGTLKDRLKKRGPLPVAKAVDAILDLIAGLEAAYAAGVLHRDIKPSNCFVSPDGSVKIGDFGLSVSTLAKDDSYITATGVIMGTPAYASPEQLRGDNLDVRADIYSVGATLFTLLTGRAPFEGENAVQVVANAVNQMPKPLSELCEDVPPGLERLVARCLAKEPDGRYADYAALRDVLLPFSSQEPEPASTKLRTPAGWIDYLVAFLIPYVILMLSIGNEEFHLRMFIDRTLYSARYYIVFLSVAFLYFGIFEGIWGAGLGKRLRGLRVVRANGRPPGIGRALIRIMIPIFCIEVVRIPISMASISATHVDGLTPSEIVIFCGAGFLCPWIPVLLTLTERRENGFATVWDLVTGTRVVIQQRGTVRPSIESAARPEVPVEGAASLGPYQVIRELIPGKWIVAADSVLRRQVWLLRRDSMEPSAARRNLGRHGRMRWLQKIETTDGAWDAFEATQGVPFSGLIEDRKRVPWGTLRHWLHDLASEVWAAANDHTLPAELSLDHVWITAQGHAVLLDEPWPEVRTEAERFPVGDVAGQQRFLNAVAAHVQSISVPLHARPMLQNLEDGKFEKTSFLTGTLRGLLDRSAEVSRGARAGSIFMLPMYIWIMIVVGILHSEEFWQSAGRGFLAITILVVLGRGLFQLVALLLSRTTCSHAIFGLVVINEKGDRASRLTVLRRWAIVWLPPMIPMTVLALLMDRAEAIALFAVLVLLLTWIGAAIYAVVRPNRGIHDRLAGTWVVRR